MMKKTQVELTLTKFDTVEVKWVESDGTPFRRAYMQADKDLFLSEVQGARYYAEQLGWVETPTSATRNPKGRIVPNTFIHEQGKLVQAREQDMMPFLFG